MPNSELLAICEFVGVRLDVVSPLKADVQSELLLPLQELVDVVK